MDNECGNDELVEALAAIERNGPARAAELFPLLYNDLHRLAQLGEFEPDLAQRVDLKFFGGFSFWEIAAMHGVSRRTVHRDWDRARVFLRGALAD